MNAPRRYRMTIAYDGTPFQGWQRQPDAPTVQGAIEDAFHRLTGGSEVAVHSCGRTDAGVHAAGQVAHFDLATPWTPAALQKGLNALLPAAVRIVALHRAAPDFHARYDARAKVYRYSVFNAPVMDPLKRFVCAHVRSPLDLDAMRAAAAMLAGTHDFAAFSANPHREIGGTVRTVFGISVVRAGRVVAIEVTGNGFLYKMVRSIAGHLLRVGRHAVDPAETATILESRTRTARVETAPACGLCLRRIWYSPRSGFPPPEHP